MQIKNFLYNRKILLLNVILCLYVVTNLIGGERGLFAYFEKKKINAILLDEEIKLSNQLYSKYVTKNFKLNIFKNNNCITNTDYCRYP